ncbi:MAG: hypothetical protein ABIK86_04980 [candidate division WOR-3 bacterium]
MKPSSDQQPGASSGPVLRPMPAPERSGAKWVARFRTGVLGVTAVLLLFTIVLVLLYRPPLPRYNVTGGAVPDTTTTAESLPSEPDQPKQTAAGPVEQTFAALATLDTVHRYAISRWASARDLLPTGSLDSATATDAVTRFRKAALLADSVRALMSQARPRVEQIRVASRQAEAGLGYRLSVAYTAADRWLAMLTSEADDQYQYLRTMEEAVTALAQDNPAGYDVKLNVANSYRRRSETRRRTLARLQGQVQEAVKALGPVQK